MQTELVNNIIGGTAGSAAVFCGNFNDLNSPHFAFNDVFSPQGVAYGGFCQDMTGMSGNISADPLFVNPAAGNYRLQAGSPAIDTGDSTASNLPATDLDGNPGFRTAMGTVRSSWIWVHMKPRLLHPLSTSASRTTATAAPSNSTQPLATTNTPIAQGSR